MIAIAVDDEVLMFGALVAAIEASPDITQVAKYSVQDMRNTPSRHSSFTPRVI